VFEGKIIGHDAAIAARDCFWPGVAGEAREPTFIDILCDPRAWRTRNLRVKRGGNTCGEKASGCSKGSDER
jgi:hypothetical protein